MVLVRPAHVRTAFRPTISWDDRRWLKWERFLYSASNSPAVGIGLLAVLAPLSVAMLPVLPLVSVALLRAPPEPQGVHEVGVAEIQPMQKKA